MTFNTVLQMRCIAIAFALALAGCGSMTGAVRYPSGWAAIDRATAAHGCPVIDGTYSDSSAGGVPPEAGPARLSEVFARMGRGHTMLPRGPAWPELPPAKSVILRLDPESLLVRFIADDGSETPLTFRRYHFNLQEKRYDDLFTCYPSDAGARLRFMAEPESHSSTSPLVVEAGGTLVFLLRASDGSLIVQWRSESLSIWATMIGSHMRFDSVWWQFPPTLQSD